MVRVQYEPIRSGYSLMVKASWAAAGVVCGGSYAQRNFPRSCARAAYEKTPPGKAGRGKSRPVAASRQPRDTGETGQLASAISVLIC